MPTSVALLFLEDDLRTVAKALQNAATHGELPSLFRDCVLSEPESVEGMPKWSRIFNALAQAQNRTGTGNFVMKFISTALSPRRFVGDPAKHEELARPSTAFWHFAVVSFWTTADFNEPHAFRQSMKPVLAQIAFDLNSNEEVFTQTCWNSAAPSYFKKTISMLCWRPPKVCQQRFERNPDLPPMRLNSR